MAKGNFFSELKRRNVYRVGAAYVVAAFVLIEVVSNVAPMFDLPTWIGRATTLLLIIGLPAVLCFAWVYEITPDGVKRTEDVENKVSIAHQTGHRLNIVIIGLMVVLAGVYGIDRFLLTDDAADQRAGSAVLVGSVSVAVLPFVNLSGDPSQEFFSDGMTEEITSALAKVKGLRVVGRTSAFEFKGQNKDLRGIGQALGTANLLEGSVRKDGNQIRVTAQLIRADDGTHIWTENYDRELKGVFAIQEEVARSIATALQMPLGLAPGESLVPSQDIDSESYEKYLRAKALYRARGGVESRNLEQATRLLEELTVNAPNYAPAWALLAGVYRVSPIESAEFLSGDDHLLTPVFDAARAKTRAAAQRAIDLDPRNAEGYAALGIGQPRTQQARMLDFLSHALELAPSNPDVIHNYADILTYVGRIKEGVALRKKLLALEPLVPFFSNNAAWTLWADGQTEAALGLAKALPIAFRGRSLTVPIISASIGRYAEAADAISSAPPGAYKPGEVDASARLLRRAPAKISPQELPVLSEPLSLLYIYAGYPERFVPSANPSPFHLMWTHPSFALYRKTAGFRAWVRASGLADFWRARGWPDLCRPVGADDFECD